MFKSVSIFIVFPLFITQTAREPACQGPCITLCIREAEKPTAIALVRAWSELVVTDEFSAPSVV